MEVFGERLKNVKLHNHFHSHTSNSGINICWRRHDDGGHDDDDSRNVNFSHREKVCISKLSNYLYEPKTVII
jgi:hypothetical protein